MLCSPLPDPDYENRKKSRVDGATEIDPWRHSRSRPHNAPYFPLVGGNTSWEDAGSSMGMIMQVEMHTQVASVL